MLRDGGRIGVVDFYVSRKYPSKNLIGQSLHFHIWPIRTFWQLWFGMDNVFLNPDHLPYMMSHFTPETTREKLANVPYIPLLKVPYYIFIGTKQSRK